MSNLHNDSIIDNFGHRLKRLRTERKITQTQLARLSGLDLSLVSKYERLNSCDPKLSTLLKLSSALGITINELLYE